MDKHDSFMLTEKTDYKFNNKGFKTFYVKQINRKEALFTIKFLFLFIGSLNIFLREKPDVIISTGALATIPICLIAKLFKRKLIFIESFSKINSSTLTGRLLYKYSDLFLIQWEDLRKFYPDAKYGGGIY